MMNGETSDLTRRDFLKTAGDDFLPGMKYIEKWGYKVDARGTVPYSN